MQKYLNRVERFLPPQVKLYFERRSEDFEDKKLLADSKELGRLTSQLLACGNFDEYLDYARSEFDLNQKTSEIQSLMELLQHQQPIVVGEIGTYRCGNLFLLHHTVKSIKKIIAVDQIFRQKGMLQVLTGNEQCFSFIQGNSCASRTFSSVRKHLGQDKFDFLFIDGDHTYEGVKSDFLTYRGLVREGGLIGFHDIVPDLTTRMKSDVPLSKCFAGGVPIFWSEINRRYPSYEFIDDVDQDGFGIGVIEYSSSDVPS